MDLTKRSDLTYCACRGRFRARLGTGTQTGERLAEPRRTPLWDQANSNRRRFRIRLDLVV